MEARSGKQIQWVGWAVVAVTVGSQALANSSSMNQGLKGTFVKKGNPLAALGYPRSIEAAQLPDIVEAGPIGDIAISLDRTSLRHTGQHFVVSSTYATKVENANFNDPNDLNYEFADSRLGELNVAAWINKTTERLKRLDLLTKKTMSVKIDAHCKEMENAHFDSSKNAICLGHVFESRGRDAFFGAAGAAWDADVVTHEYGHAVFHHLATLPQGQSLRYLSLGNDQIGAMNEGQADFQAFAATGNVKLAPWFMYVVTDRKEDVLRHVDNTYRMDRDAFSEIHEDGQIMAGTLYDLSKAIGVEEVTKLWLNTIPKLSDMDNMFDVSRYMIQADESLNRGRHRQAIVAAFAARGIMGHADIDSNLISMAVKVTDTAEANSDVQLTFFQAFGVLLPTGEAPNGNGRLDAGECAVVDLVLKNQDSKDLVGVEVFIPEVGMPTGAVNLLANRHYMGIVKAGQNFPVSQSAAMRRPWMYVCAESTYRGGDMQVIVRNASWRQARVKTSLETTAELLRPNGWATTQPTPIAGPAVGGGSPVGVMKR